LLCRKQSTVRMTQYSNMSRYENKTTVVDVRGDASSDDNQDRRSGSSHDYADMHRLGKKQELKRNFHSISILGLTCVILSTWMGITSTSTFSLINGGRAGTIWMFLATWIFTIPVVASMAEMASMAPTAGGQYHWVSEFAPPSMQKFLSYISGWLSALGWQAFIASAAFQSAATILTLASMSFPAYEPQVWQTTVLTMGVGVFAISFNAFGAKRLPMFEGAVLFFYVVGFFAITIPLWVLAPKAPLNEVFGDFENYGGWSTLGGGIVVGQMAASAAFIGVDSAVHMSEEVKNASIVVPRMMMFTILLNGVTGLVMIITYVLSIQSVEEQILGSTSPFPFIGVFQAATNSTAGAIGMTVPIIIMTLSMTINATAAASRQAWSFARDDGLPFSRSWFTKVVTINSTPLPINAMITSLCILVVVALLNFGGSEVFNSIIGLMTGAVGLTYAISIGCVLWRRLYGAPLPPARWSLGRFGVAINIVGFLFEMFQTTISFFPLFKEVTAVTMNWGIAMFGGVAVICIINYVVHARKVYQGPVVKVMKEF